MKALLVAAAPVDGSAELVSRLAADADLIVAVDGGGEVCLAAGVVPHVLLGDMDSISQAARDALRAQGVPQRTFPAEKDSTDLELAVAYARDAGATSLTVTAAASGRLDHTLAALGALGRAADLSARLVEPTTEVRSLAADGRVRELRVAGVGARVSVFAWAGAATVSIAGARWPLEGHRMEPMSGLGLGNVVTADSGAVVRVHDGVVLVVTGEGLA